MRNRCDCCLHLLFGILLIGLESTGVLAAPDNAPAGVASSPGVVWTMAGNANGYLFAGTNVGVFRALDGDNLAWTRTALTDTRVFALAAQPNGDVFAATWDGIYRTRDDGASWEEVSQGLTFRTVHALAVDPNRGHLYAGTQGGVFRSEDDGDSWSAAGLDSLTVRSLVAGDDGFLVAGTDHTVEEQDPPTGDLSLFLWISRDQGASWTGVTNDRLPLRRGMALALRGNDNIYVATHCCSVRGEIYYSDTDTLEQLFVPGGIFASGVGHAITAQGDFVFAGFLDTGVFRWNALDSTWAEINVGLTNTAVYSLTVFNNRVWAGTASGGVFLWEPNANFWLDNSIDFGGGDPPPIKMAAWTEVATDFAAESFTTILADPGMPLLLGTLRGGGYRSGDNGTTWQPMGEDLPSTVYSFATLPSGDLLAGTLAGLYRSADQGATWTLAAFPDTLIWPILSHPDGALYVSAFDQGLFVSQDDGASWSQTTSGARTLTLDQTGVLYAGFLGVERTTHLGTRWLFRNDLSEELAVRSLVVDYQGNLFTASDRGVWLSEDGGDSWGLTALEGTPMWSLVYQPNGLLVAGGEDGVFASNDGGERWTALNEGLPEAAVLALGVTPDGHLLAGTRGAGLYRSRVEVEVAVAPAEAVPEGFVLGQNYPNPFRTITRIPLTLPQHSHVSLKIYNTLGQVVATVVAEPMAPGAYTVEWQAGDLASGVYFYQAQAGERVETRKLILVR